MSSAATSSNSIEFRVGLGSCGIANGARPVHEAVEAAVREAGHGVVKAVGCGGSCYREPLVEVVEDNGPATGALAMITHHSDVRFGNITVTPL